MDDTHVVWDLEDDEDGNVQHIQEHGISMDEVEEVLFSRGSQISISNSSGYPITFGYTDGGRYLAVVLEHVLDEPLTIRPITAYDTPEPTSRKPKRRKR